MSEAMATEAEAKRALTQLHALCAGLKGDLAKAMEVRKTSPNGSMARMVVADGSYSLLELKEVNRTVWEVTAALKARAAAANQDVDAADLKLQNLQYEKNYFLREVIRPLRCYRARCCPWLTMRAPSCPDPPIAGLPPGQTNRPAEQGRVPGHGSTRCQG